MLKVLRRRYYRVKKGENAENVCREFSVPPCLFTAENGLEEGVGEGQIVLIPENKYHLYTVRGGDSKAALCGSEERYEAINGTSAFYVGMKIFIP